MRTCKAILLAIVLVIGLAPGLSAAAPAALTWQGPPPVGPASDLSGVTYGNGLYVAVGPAGTIMTSADAKHWTKRAAGTPMPLNGVAYGGGRYVAVGGEFDANRWVSKSVLLTSADGKSWSSIPVEENNGPLKAVTYANGRFVAVGDSEVMTSSDGMTWSAPRAAPADDLKAVTYGNGQFVAIGSSGLIRSADGATWTRSTDVYQGRGVAFGGGKFVAINDTRDLKPEYLTSADGRTWSRSTPAVMGVEQLTYASGRFVGVGFDHGTGNAAIATSSDGVTWLPVATGISSWLKGVAPGPGGFVAVGSGGAILTLDETGNWAERPLSGSANLSSVAYGSGRFVAVGDHGILITSADGTTWTQRNAGVQAKWERVRYGNGRFVAIGRDGSIITSADGLDWHEATRPAATGLAGLEFGNGRFVAVGHPGAILTSVDGTTWTARDSGTTDSLLDVAYGQGRFYAFVWGGDLLASTDGATWTKAGKTMSELLWRLVYVGGRLFGNSPLYGISATDDMADLSLKGASNWMWWLSEAARGSGWQVTVGAQGARSSRDGVTWTPDGGDSSCMQAVTYGAGRFVGVGLNGCIRTAVAEQAGASAVLPLPDRVKLSRPTIAPPPGFRDLPPGHWAFQPVGAAVNAELVKGYPEGVFLPDVPIRRAEFLAVLMRAYPQAEVLGEPFADVPADHWAYTLIRQARGAGLVVGDGNRFRPNDSISRAEMAVILQRAVKLPLPAQPASFPDMGAAWSWAAEPVQALSAHGLLRGLPDGSFGPGRSATRAETAAILTRLFGQ